MSHSPLQFVVSEVPEVPRAIQFERGLDWGTEILADGVYKVRGETGFDGKVRRIDDGLLLELDISLPVEFLCSRCGERVDLDYTQAIKHLFVRGTGDEVSLPLDVELDPELDISEFTGTQCDAESAVVGALASELPDYPVCSTECEPPEIKNMARESDEPVIDPRLAPLLAIRESMAQDPPSTQNEI